MALFLRHVRRSVLVVVALAASTTSGFQQHVTTKRNFASTLTLNEKPFDSEFEYQELNIQLNAMEKQEVKSTMLRKDKREELENYVRQIVNRRPSPIQTSELQKQLPNTKWKLAFSTQGLASDLPRDATIMLDFKDEQNLKYCMEFSKKTLGMDRIVANSSYTVNVSRN
jgi:hypothetical protein